MKTTKKADLSTQRRHLPIKMLALAAGLVLPTANGLAQTYWQGGTSDFNNAASWNGTYIDGADNANPNPNCSNDSGSNNVVLIQPGDVAWYHGDTLAGNNANNSGSYLQTGSTNFTGYPANGNWLRMGINTGTYGSYVLSNGVVNVAGRTQLGENGVGYLEVDGGVFNTGYNGNPGIGVANGDMGPSATGTLVLTGGTINNIGNETWFGEANTADVGYLFMSGGTFNVNNWFVFGRNGGQGYGVMTGGTINFTGNGQFLVGGGGIGSLIQSGGTINVQNQYLVPQSGGGVNVGTNILSGTAVLNTHDWIAIGRDSGYGELDISGNASITRDNGNDGGANFDIGAGGPGIVNQNGGAITNNGGQVWIGENSSATWNLNSGIANLGTVHLSQTADGAGTLNLNGGTLIVAQLTTGSTTAGSALHLNGGTIVASASSTAFIQNLTIADIGVNGVTFDSQGNNITVAQELDDAGGGNLIKNGAGMLTLSGPNTYAGDTIINAGVLQVGTASTAGGAVTAANTAGFGTITVSQNGQTTVSSLTMGGAAGGSLNFNLAGFGNPTSAPLSVGGAFTANGPITVNLAASVLSIGTIPLLQYGSLAGSQTFVLGSLPSGVAGNLAMSGNTLELVVTRAAAPRWDGNAGGTWDLGSDLNWYDLGSMQPTSYSDGNPVIFDDNASGTTTVNLTATVAPSSINFNNNSLPYTIAGTGKITGNIGLNLNGTANVSILNTGGNTFTGPVIVNAGVLSVTNLANGGSPSPLGASSSSPTNLVLAGGIFQYVGAPVTANRGFMIGATNSTVDAEGNLTLSGQVSVTSGNGFTKIGPAQLALTGTNDNEFAIGLNPGVQIEAGTLLLDGSAGGQINHNQNDFYVGCTTATGASLIVSNTTLNVDGWFGVGRINGGINNTSTWTFYNATIHAGNVTVGWDGGQGGNLSSQIIALNGNTMFTNYGAVNMDEGSGSTMWMSINDNSVYWVQNAFYIASATGSTGTVVVANSGKIISVNQWFDIGEGNNSVGTLILKDNGSLTTAGDLNVSDTGTGSTSTVIAQDNSVISVNNIWVGKDDGVTASLTITNNATVVSGNGLTMATYYDNTARVPNAAVLNLSGGSLAVNLVQGSTTAGTNNGVFNFNGGKLIFKPTSGYSGPNFMFNLEAINILPAGGSIEIDNSSVAYIAQPLLGGNGDGGLTKLGTGTLLLNAVNTYTNTTTVSAGTFGGSGTINGPVTVAAGAALTADAGTIGNFTINGALTLATGSTTLMQITPTSNDQVVGLTSVSYSGALVVTNSGGTALTPGHVYQLFNAASSSGNFTSVTVLPSGSGTFNPATGQLTIAAASPVINNVILSGGNLTITGSGGTAGGYTVLSSTNLLTPMANWTTNTTGTIGGSGTFTNAIPVSATTPEQFFRVRQP